MNELSAICWRTGTPVKLAAQHRNATTAKKRPRARSAGPVALAIAHLLGGAGHIARAGDDAMKQPADAAHVRQVTEELPDFARERALTPARRRNPPRASRRRGRTGW